MSDPEIQRLRAKYQEDRRTSRFIPEMKARTGRLQSTTTVAADPRVYDATGVLVTNKLWVRLAATKANPAGRGQVAVWNFDKVATDKADLAVILVEGADGDLYIDRADTAAADTSGVPAGFYGDSGARPEELSRVLVPLANIADLQPIVDPVNGALYIYIKPGWLPNGRWWPGGRYDLTSDVTATAGMKAFVVGGIDLDTLTIVADTGVDRSLAFNPMPASDIEAVLATFDNVYPVFAVPLANGATTFTNTQIVDIRTLGNGSGSGAGSSGGSGWTVDYNALVPAGRDFNIVGAVSVESGYTLTVEGELFVL